jgi:hypothetical protein
VVGPAVKQPLLVLLLLPSRVGLLACDRQQSPHHVFQSKCAGTGKEVSPGPPKEHSTTKSLRVE